MKRKGCARWFLLVDNLSVHKVSDVKTYLSKYRIPCVYLVPYVPKHAGIESLWALAKRNYRRNILKALINEEAINIWN